MSSPSPSPSNQRTMSKELAPLAINPRAKSTARRRQVGGRSSSRSQPHLIAAVDLDEIEEHPATIGRGSVTAAVVLFGLVFLQAAFLAVHIKALSPYDEGANYDYVIRAMHGSLPIPAGTHYLDTTIQAWACRPTDKATSLAGICGRPTPPAYGGVPFEGVNYNAQFGPLYYLIAAGGARALSVIGIGSFTAARLVSALLYAAGSAALLLVTQRLKRGWVGPAGLILAASMSGLALSSGATITPDSTAFLYTAGVVASALLARSWARAVGWTAVLMTLAGLTKPNFIVVAVLASALLLLRWVYIERPSRTGLSVRSHLSALIWVCLPVVTCAVSGGAWSALSRSRAQPGASFDGGVHLYLQSSLGPVARVAQQVAALVQPNGGTAPGAAFTALDSSLVKTGGLIVVIATMGASLWSWLGPDGTSFKPVIVLRSTALAIPVAAIALTVTFYVFYDGSLQTASRYGLPFLAATAIGAGVMIRRKAAPFVALFGAAMWIGVFVAVLRA
jgi:hypothetical protein